MRAAILGFVAGAALLQQQAELPAVSLLSSALCLGLLVLWASGLPGSSWIRMSLRAAAGMVAGFAWAALFAHAYLARELPADWEGRDIVLVGVVDNLPARFDQGVRFHLTVEQVDGATPPAGFPERVSLSWYARPRAGAQTMPEVQAGERWRLNVRLRRPYGNANPHGFDYEVWLLEQNLRATGHVRDDPRLAQPNLRLDAFVPGFNTVVQRSRAWLRNRIERALPERTYAGVIVALVIGEQRAIAQADWNIFNRTGIGHLISISGLHITMIAAMFASLVQALWRRSFFTRAQLPLLLPAQKAAALAAVISALVYVLLAGGGIPAQRTLYMLAVVALALWCGRAASFSHVLCAALGVVVLLDPWAVLQPGFWLSFGAVAVILYTNAGREPVPEQELSWRERWKQRLHGAARLQYAITLGLVPLTLLLFAQVSVVSPLANAIAIPLVSFFVTPMALVGSVLPSPLADWVLGAAHWLILMLARFLGWLSASPFAVWSAPVPAWWAFAAALVGIAWMLAPRGWPLRVLGLVCLLPLLLTGVRAPAVDSFWVTAFDVGQGMALLVETPNHRLLYDAGPAYSPEADGGSRVILPYLKGRGIHAIDTLVVSHSDIDHVGGALSVLGQIAVGEVVSSLEPWHPVALRAARHVRCEAGQSWDWDGVRFEMLYPAPAVYRSDKWKPNARSCTLRIASGRHAMLLPGDIEAIQEGHLLAADAKRLQANVLLAPHHGSGTSSTLPFLEAVAPQLALFQVGRANRYRHPKEEVYQRYGELGIERLRTDETGAVTLRFGDQMEVNAYRIDRRRYWHGR